MPVWSDPWSTPPSTLSLPGAIQDKVRGDLDSAFIDGGLTYGRTPTFDPPVKRYMTLFFIAEFDWWTTGVQRVNVRTYQLNAYATTLDECEFMLDIFTEHFNHTVFDQTPMPFRNGTCFNCIPGTAVLDPREYPQDNGPLMRRMHKDYRFYCNRTIYAYQRS